MQLTSSLIFQFEIFLCEWPEDQLILDADRS